MLNWDGMQIYTYFILIVRKFYEFIVCVVQKFNSRPYILDKFSTNEPSIQHK